MLFSILLLPPPTPLEEDLVTGPAKRPEKQEDTRELDVLLWGQMQETTLHWVRLHESSVSRSARHDGPMKLADPEHVAITNHNKVLNITDTPQLVVSVSEVLVSIYVVPSVTCSLRLGGNSHEREKLSACALCSVRSSGGIKSVCVCLRRVGGGSWRIRAPAF